jgi:hypothetical protein
MFSCAQHSRLQARAAALSDEWPWRLDELLSAPTKTQ